MEVMKRSTVQAKDLVGHVVYVWLGKMRWLPHLGPAHLVVGSRADHVIAVPVNAQRKPIGQRVWIRITDLAIWCDAYEEFAAVQVLIKQYRISRNSVDEHYARVISKMGKKEKKRLTRARVRKRPVSSQ